MYVFFHVVWYMSLKGTCGELHVTHQIVDAFSLHHIHMNSLLKKATLLMDFKALKIIYAIKR